MNEYHFLSWVRRGVATGIQAQDPLTGPIPEVPTIRPQLSMDRRVEGQDKAETITFEGPKLSLAGPSQVCGFDPAMVSRVYPAPGATRLTNEFAHIEFWRADFPWLFTPAAPLKQTGPDKRSGLRPWIALIVLPEGEFEGPYSQGGTSLSSIRVSTTELPDLSESWAWAHAQVAGHEAGSVAEAVRRFSTGTCSRLICPRRLEEHKAFRAFVVPAFEGGRRTGLGQSLSNPQHGLQPAWTVGRREFVTLPVYYFWCISQKSSKGFEDLARLLVAKEAVDLTGVGAREVDVSHPWWPRLRPLAEMAGGDTETRQTVMLDGALKLPEKSDGSDAVKDSLTPKCRAKFEEVLESQLNVAASERITVRKKDEKKKGEKDEKDDNREKQDSATDDVQSVGPPIYGARFRGLSPLPSEAGWLRNLNLNIRRRLAASFGTSYIQEHQETLMAGAWEQLPEIRAANWLRCLSEFAAVVADGLHKRHITTLTASELVTVTAPAHGRTPVAAGVTLLRKIQTSSLPNAAATPAFTRAMRKHGPLARGFRGAQTTNLLERGLSGAVRINPVTTLNRRISVAAPIAERRATNDPLILRGVTAAQSIAETEKRILAVGLKSLQHRSDTPSLENTSDLNRIRQSVQQGLARRISPEKLRTQTISEIASDLSSTDVINAGIKILQSFKNPQLNQEEAVQLQTATAVRTEPVELASLRSTLVKEFTPSPLIIKRLADRIEVPEELRPADPLGPIMAGPQFPIPVATLLRDKHRELLMPGIENFPDNTVTLMETNPAFIEALLVGMNHEMNRELLWREFPTDQRGTPFRNFWPKASGSPDEAPPIHTWIKKLGDNLNGGNGECVALTVRGELFQAFPKLDVYAATGKYDSAGALVLDSPIYSPRFQMELTEDMRAYVFTSSEIDQEKLMRTEGPNQWYFIFQESPTGPRFGFDNPPDPPKESSPADPAKEPPPVKSWNDLTWAHVHLDRKYFVSVSSGLEKVPGDARWNHTAAEMARITLQKPFQMIFHAHMLIAPQSLRKP